MEVAAARRNVLVLWIGILAVVSGQGLHGQSFRGEITARETLSSDDVIEQEMGTGDVLLFRIDDSTLRFFTGVEITLSTESGTIAPGSYSATIYGAVDPPEGNGVRNLAGQRLSTIPLTDPTSHRIVIPFGSTGSGTRSNITRDADPTIGDIAIQLVPIMKGMDSSSLSASYSVRITPRLRPVGAVKIGLAGDEDLLRRTRDELVLTLDGETIDTDVIEERAPGIYRLTAQAGDFLDETANVGVEQGRIREIILKPREPAATVRVSVPTVAEVYWNGTRLFDHDHLSVPPGEHSVMIRLGDFTVSRRIELAAHETYELAIDLDILINQN